MPTPVERKRQEAARAREIWEATQRFLTEYGPDSPAAARMTGGMPRSSAAQRGGKYQVGPISPLEVLPDALRPPHARQDSMFGRERQAPPAQTPRVPAQPSRRRDGITRGQVRNILLNETGSLHGPGVQDVRVAMASSVHNADDIFGDRRKTFADTADDEIRRPLKPLDLQALREIEAAISANDARRLATPPLPDPVNGATNFHMRPHYSTQPPQDFAPDFQI